MIEKQSVAEINDKYQLDVSTMLDLPVPLECVAGIEANCELLRVHARKVEGFEIPEASDEDSQE